jgi:streptogramin lyase
MRSSARPESEGCESDSSNWEVHRKSDSEPYGIAITNDGVVWYSESGVKPKTLVRFDPKSDSFSTKQIASGGGVVRNAVSKAVCTARQFLAQ